MKKILVATDFSERSDRALRRALLLAKQFMARIALVHVVDDDQPRSIVDSERQAAETLLSTTADTLRRVDGVSSEARVILADPFVGITQAVEESGSDLLVIGPHRRQVLRDIFVGTTAERTIRSVDCPVLMVNAPPAGDYRHILMTTDLSDGSRLALQRLPALGIAGRARNSLLYIFESVVLRQASRHSLPRDEQDHYRDSEQKAASQDLARFVASADIGPVELIVQYAATLAQHEILNAARARQADLIVLATRGRTGVAGFFIGSVTKEVLGMAPVDVLAIPPAREDVDHPAP